MTIRTPQFDYTLAQGAPFVPPLVRASAGGNVVRTVGSDYTPPRDTPERALGLDFSETIASLQDFSRIVGDFVPPMPSLEASYQRLASLMFAAVRDAQDSRLRLDTAEVADPLYRQSSALVNYSYASRFSNDGVFDEIECAEHSACVVVRLCCERNPLVLATVQVSWGSDFDVFRLFESSDSANRDAENGRQGSIDRFAMHPLFDALFASRLCIGKASFCRLDALRSTLFKMMLHQAFEMLAAKGATHIYCITHDTLNRLFVRWGVRSEKMIHARIADTPEVRRLYSRYPRYWENEPAVFRLHGMR